MSPPCSAGSASFLKNQDSFVGSYFGSLLLDARQAAPYSTRKNRNGSNLFDRQIPTKASISPIFGKPPAPPGTNGGSSSMSCRLPQAGGPTALKEHFRK